MVKRNHGKVELASERLDSPLRMRYQKNHNQKQVIAAKAALHLKENSVIFIDGSSTCLHMVPHISQFKNLTVYTNSLELGTLLAGSNVNICIVGGHLIPRALACAGEYAIQMIQSVQFDTLFFSCSGICDGIISDYAEHEAHLRRELIKRSRGKFFLCDTSKFGQSFHYVVCEESEVTEIITEENRV